MSAIWPTPTSLRIRTSPRGLCLGLLEKGWAEEDARGLRALPKRLETTATSRSARYQPPRFRRGPASWASLRGPRLKEEEEETPRPDPRRGPGRRGARPSPASAPQPGLTALQLGPAPASRPPRPASPPASRPQQLGPAPQRFGSAPCFFHRTQAPPYDVTTPTNQSHPASAFWPLSRPRPLQAFPAPCLSVPRPASRPPPLAAPPGPRPHPLGSALCFFQPHALLSAPRPPLHPTRKAPPPAMTTPTTHSHPAPAFWPLSGPRPLRALPAPCLSALRPWLREARARTRSPTGPGRRPTTVSPGSSAQSLSPTAQGASLRRRTTLPPRSRSKTSPS